MIFDTIKNRHIYLPISQDIKSALDYLAGTDFMPIATGRYEIDGERFYVLVQEYDSVTKTQSRWECHKKYIDIQFIASGIEQIGVTNTCNLTEVTEYNPDRDIMFLKGDGDYITIKKDSYGIFSLRMHIVLKLHRKTELGKLRKSWLRFLLINKK